MFYTLTERYFVKRRVWNIIIVCIDQGQSDNERKLQKLIVSRWKCCYLENLVFWQTSKQGKTEDKQFGDITQHTSIYKIHHIKSWTTCLHPITLYDIKCNGNLKKKIYVLRFLLKVTSKYKLLLNNFFDLYFTMIVFYIQ